MEIFGILILVWVVCGVLAYGITLAYFTAKWPQFAYKNRKSNLALLRLMGFSGPFGLIIAFFFSGFCKYGLRFKSLSEAESWKAFHDAYPGLPESYWQDLKD